MYYVIRQVAEIKVKDARKPDIAASGWADSVTFFYCIGCDSACIINTTMNYYNCRT